MALLKTPRVIHRRNCNMWFFCNRTVNRLTCSSTSVRHNLKMASPINDVMAAIALHAHFVCTRNMIEDYVNMKRSAYGETAKLRINTLVQYLADAARNSTPIYTDALWNELEAIGVILLHHKIEAESISRTQLSSIRRAMMAPRHFMRYYGLIDNLPRPSSPTSSTSSVITVPSDEASLEH